MNINRLNIIGIFMIIMSILIILVNSIDKIVLQLTYPFLMGSSQGKALIFFFLMGSMLLLSPIVNNSKIIRNSKIINKSGNYYLKLVIILVMAAYIVGLILEIWIRSKFGVSLFTTFVSTSPSISSSSLIHSHVFKSMLSILISDLGIYLPLNIHTGISLAQYVPKFALIIFAVFPMVYFLGILSLENRKDIHRFILVFALSTSLIGILDGGIFSAPALVGLSGLLGVCAIKKPFSPRNLLRPSYFIILLLIIRILLGLIGSNPDVYVVTVIGGNGEIDIQGLNVIDEKVVGEKTIITISSDLNELIFLNQIFNLLKNKYPIFFVSWNFYSFFT